ncbi:hypothetical protein [Pseudooceanicola nanhaiensis]|uniref:hypothetical protein n=1 Tax=Pseudooceanicola nanhaiensis TaxID=375761 RepID=UPI001CD2137A|nr:hypothetical protein [Pseudooceanicola nanhaiensis]MCA0922195.1 hypothetical protein [Pseudooceanicola nanhaiensis]
MKDDWFHRLEELILADGRSYRQISEAAKCGPNFVQQLLKERKDPRASQLARLFNALGPSAAIYVITGLRLGSDDLEFLATVSALDIDARRDALSILRRLATPSFPEERSRGGQNRDFSTS